MAFNKVFFYLFVCSIKTFKDFRVWFTISNVEVNKIIKSKMFQFNFSYSYFYFEFEICFLNLKNK